MYRGCDIHSNVHIHAHASNQSTQKPNQGIMGIGYKMLIQAAAEPDPKNIILSQSDSDIIRIEEDMENSESKEDLFQGHQ